MSILDNIQYEEYWKNFLLYKQQNNLLSKNEIEGIEKFIADKKYLDYYQMIQKGNFPTDFPHKKIVNKEGSDKKRIVYSFDTDDNIILKFIAHQLTVFDSEFSKNCYSFRQGYGVKDAILQFKGNKKYSKKHCLKVDIKNYFNSINIDLLIEKLTFLKEKDLPLYNLFTKILSEDRVYEQNTLIHDTHGAMAGIPVSPFFANIYLTIADKFFEAEGISYFRYSDDILIFADTKEQLDLYTKYLYDILEEHKLEINPSKFNISEPGETWEFLGFSYSYGKIDLSDNTKRKIKAKIRRKADALRRWQRKKELSPDKAAIGFIRAMNRKFFGIDDTHDFTWNRWFFPNITEDAGLKEIDAYMQEYIRYTITGRHYKGNYRITYDRMKGWGYRSLVNEYYKFKKESVLLHKNDTNY